MSPISAYLNFCLRFGGRRSLLELIEALNQGKKQTEIAKLYGIDKGQLSRYISTLTTRRYYVSPDIQEHISRELGEETRQATGLRLITKDDQ